MASEHRHRWCRWFILLPAAVLLTAVAVQAVDLFREVPAAKPLHVAGTVPSSLAGWTERELPLGPNEFVSKEAEKILNCDEVVNREFRRGDQVFTVYVAYWRPGKMPVRMVACHTPDRCWTENGWRCLEMRFKQSLAIENLQLKPAEWRKFEPPAGGEATYVLFWHLVDGELYNYGERFNSIPDPRRWVMDALRQAFVGCSEQYFIRISSNQPLETIRSDPGFRRVVEKLGSLGLGASSRRG